MAWWLTIYCRKPVSHLTAADIARGLVDEDPAATAGGDYYTAAEGYGIEDEAVVDAALDRLTVEAMSDKPLDLQVRYGARRPLVVHLWHEPGRLAEVLAETNQERSPPDSVKSRLAETVEIVAIELGLSQLRTMGIVIACELARFFAQHGDALVVDDDDAWSRVTGGQFEPPH